MQLKNCGSSNQYSNVLLIFTSNLKIFVTFHKVHHKINEVAWKAYLLSWTLQSHGSTFQCFHVY